MNHRLKTFCLLALCLIIGQGRILGQTPLLSESFENAATVTDTQLNDAYHAGGTSANLSISTSISNGGSKSLELNRRDSGFYYARSSQSLSSATGAISVTFWVNFTSKTPYWWNFTLDDISHLSPYVQLDVSYHDPGMLRFMGPDGTWRRLCQVQTGWKQFRIDANFVTKTCTVYYDNITVPLAMDLPLFNQNSLPSSAFFPSFSGVSSAGEAVCYLDDLAVNSVTTTGSTVVGENFESASDIIDSVLSDIYHGNYDNPGDTGATARNIVLSTPGHSGSGGQCLKWTRINSGFYYARDAVARSSSTGAVSISFWMNMESTTPYNWQFNLQDNNGNPYLQLESSHNDWSMLRWLNPDGSYKRLCSLKSGWTRVKLDVDFVSKICNVYYGDMQVPVGSDLPLYIPDTTAGTAFKSAFTGFSTAGEAAASVDDFLIQTWTRPGAILFSENFETATTVSDSQLPDTHHDVDTAANIQVASPGFGGSNSKCLKWLRHDTGGYYSRPPYGTWYSSSTGALVINFWANLGTSFPYNWVFEMFDTTGTAPYVRLEQSQPSNEPSELRYSLPNGSYARLTSLQAGWRQFKIEVDFVKKICNVYYDDMVVPVGASLPLANQSSTSTTQFKPSWAGFSSAGEAPVSIDNLLMREWTPDAGISWPTTENFVLSSASSGQTVNVSKSSGALTGLSRNTKALMAGSSDIYLFQSNDASAWSSEEQDQVLSSSGDASQLVLTCYNTGMPGLGIVKKYSFDSNGNLLKRVAFSSTAAGGFLTYIARVKADASFMAGSYPCGFPFTGGTTGYPFADGNKQLQGIPYRISTDNSCGLNIHRSRVNDRFVLGGDTRGLTDGWDLTVFCDYVDPGHSISGEIAFCTFSGDFVDYEKSMTASADYQSLFNTTRPSWVDSLVCDTMYAGTNEGNQMHAALAPLPATASIWFLNPPWGNWWGNSEPPLSYHHDVYGIAPGIKSYASNARISAYANSLFDQRSDVYAHHRDFGVTGRDSLLQNGPVPSDSGGAQTYLLQILNSTARQYWIDMLADKVRTWSLDYLYLDGPGGYTSKPDWVYQRNSQYYEWLDFYRDLKARITQQNPNAIFFTNGLQPYSDVGYLEWTDQMWQALTGSLNEWVYSARGLLLRKLGEGPNYVTVPLYDKPQNQPALATYSINYGWCGNQYNQSNIPWMLASLEYRNLQFINGGILQKWWTQPSPTVESYALRKGRSVIINAIGHGAATSTSVTLDCTRTGLTVGKTYLCRVMTMNSPASSPTPSTAFVTNQVSTFTPSRETVQLVLPISNGLLTSVLISEAACVVEGIGSKTCQTGIPENYGAQVVLQSQSGSDSQYSVSCAYAPTTLFFPYASTVSTSSSATHVSVTVNGIPGRRVTFNAAGTYSATVTAAVPTNTGAVFSSYPVTVSNATWGVPYSDSLAGLATDPNAGGPFVFSKISGPAWLSVASNGALSGTPGHSDVGTNVFTVSVINSQGFGTAATLNINVTGANHAPVFSNDTIVGTNTQPGSAYSSTLIGTATDSDNDTLTYEKLSGPAWLNIASDGTLTGTPQTGDSGVNVWMVRVKDGFGGSDIARLTIQVLAYPTNNYGTLQGNSTTNLFNPGYINRIQLADLDKTSGNDNGYADFRSLAANLVPGQSVSYTFTPAGNFSSVRWSVWIDFNRDGDFKDPGEMIVGPTTGSSSAVNGSFTVPSDASVGPSRMRIAMRRSSTGQTSPTGSFSYGEVEDYSVQIGTSPPPNAAPYFLSGPITKPDMTAGTPMSGSLAADAGDWEGGPLTYAKISGPAWLMVASNGTLSGTPPTSTRGVNSFTVSVTDGSGGTDTATLQVNVLNNAPVATAQSLSTPWQTPVAVTLSGSDADGDALIFAVDSQPANGVLSGTAPALIYTPGASFSGTDSFTFHVNDGSVNSAAATVTLVVAPAPYSPVYQDNFNRTGVLNGSTPTITTGGNTWSSSNWSTDGSAAKPAANGFMAILPFTPVQGNIYTLSASMNPIGVPDPSDWFVLGFTGRNATDNWFVYDQYSASAGARGSNSVYPDFYYNGPGLSGNLSNFTDGVAHVYSITLDTTAGNPANWTVAYSVDNTQVVATTALGYAPTINYVGFGNAATEGTIDNFSLTVVAVPGSSPYAGWATDNAGGQAANLDWDNDGVTNGVEFFMNAAPGFTANPSFVGNTVSWTNGGNISASTYGTQFIVQTSSDLVTWEDVAEGDLNTNTSGPGGSLSYSVDPANGPAKQFVRLKVTPN